MKASKSAEKLHKMISKAIEDHKLTRDEYDLILHQASEDNHIDRHEQALLEQLQDMIENKTIKLVAR
jgi:pyoverdine/dityrosine biosynthesis protein Dit1